MQEKLEKKVVQVLEKIWHVLCGKKILFGQEVLTDEKKNPGLSHLQTFA